MVLALINTVFPQDNQEAAIEQWYSVADQLRSKFPKFATLMDEAESDVLAFMSLPKAHHVEIHSTPGGRPTSSICGHLKIPHP